MRTADLEYLHETIEDEFATIYKQAERTAAKLEVTPALPQTAMKQQHWNNVLPENPEEYYKQTIAIPFIVRFI